MKIKSLLVLTLLIILCAACSPRVQVDYPTTTATNTPDTQATEAQIALLAAQTAEAEEAAITQATQAAEATALRAVELTTVAEVLATEEAVNEQQAGLTTGQATLAAEQAAVANAQSDFIAASTESAAFAVTLQVESAVLATANSDLAAEQQTLSENQAALTAEQEALVDGQATLAAANAALANGQQALIDEQGALATTNGILADAQETLEAEQQTLAADQIALGQALEQNAAAAGTNEAIAVANETLAAQLASDQQAVEATAEALAILATALAPTATPLPPTAIPWQEVTVPELGITLLVPPQLKETARDNETITFEDEGSLTDDTAPTTSILLTRVSLAELLIELNLADSSDRDPISLLSAMLHEPLEEELFTVIEDVQPTTAQPYDSASVVVDVAEFDLQAWIVLLQIHEDDWLLFVMLGTPDQIATWKDPFLQGLQITPVEAPTILPTEAFTTPTLIPTAIPTEASTEEGGEGAAVPPLEDLNTAIGVNFIVPEGWSGAIQEDESFARPIIGLEAPDATNNIALVHATLSELNQVLDLELPPDGDPVNTLSTIMAKQHENQEGFSGGRVNEVTVGSFSGAWSQLRSDTEVLRYYLFPTDTEEWLLIIAHGPRATFNDFNQNELSDFLASLALPPNEGVALGLDFVVPEGWTLQPGDEHNVRLVAPPDLSREIALSRGMAEEFDLPADVRDPAEALGIVAEDVNDELALGSSVRVQPVEIANLSGAFATLRNDDLMVRLYLLPVGEEWLFIMANASREDFNDFNRTELRDFFASLKLANAAAPSPLTISEPIGPIEEVTVVRVSDGDTIYVLLNGVEESVRIIGINTPEAHHPDSGADWGGYAATHFIETLTPAGSTVYLESDIRDRDDFDRLLRYVWIKDDDGNWVNVEVELIRAGKAAVVTYDEDRYVQVFHALEEEARNAERGIWGPAPPPPPVESLAERNDTVWAANPVGATLPLLYDAAALGNVPDPYGVWPNNIPATVRDVYYVYPTDIDPVTGQPVSDEKVGYWYWLEINDFRGWVPEGWLLLAEPAEAVPPPATDIIAYAQPFIATEEALDVRAAPGSGAVLGSFAPESRVQVEKLAYDPVTETWWLFADTKTLDGWVPLAGLNRLSAENR